LGRGRGVGHQPGQRDGLRPAGNRWGNRRTGPTWHERHAAAKDMTAESMSVTHVHSTGPTMTATGAISKLTATSRYSSAVPISAPGDRQDGCTVLAAICEYRCRPIERDRRAPSARTE
jgi:hypothetical protein